MNQAKNAATLLDYHKTRIQNLELIKEMRERLEATLQPMIDEQKAKLEALGEE